MPNSNPSPGTRFAPEGKEPLDRRTVGTKLPTSATEIVRSLPDKSERLRYWILQGMAEDGLIDPMVASAYKPDAAG